MHPLAAAIAVALTPAPVSAAQAVARIGRPVVVVEMVVRQAKDRTDKRGVVYLDSEDDSRDPKNLGVALSAGVAAKLRAQGVADVAAHFKGKTIRVRGCVMRFEERAYLPVLDPAQVVVVPPKAK